MGRVLVAMNFLHRRMGKWVQLLALKREVFTCRYDVSGFAADGDHCPAL